jgi:hypothetical protein
MECRICSGKSVDVYLNVGEVDVRFCFLRSRASDIDIGAGTTSGLISDLSQQRTAIPTEEMEGVGKGWVSEKI